MNRRALLVAAALLLIASIALAARNRSAGLPVVMSRDEVGKTTCTCVAGGIAFGAEDGVSAGAKLVLEEACVHWCSQPRETAPSPSDCDTVGDGWFKNDKGIVEL